MGAREPVRHETEQNSKQTTGDQGGCKSDGSLVPAPGMSQGGQRCRFEGARRTAKVQHRPLRIQSRFGACATQSCIPETLKVHAEGERYSDEEEEGESKVDREPI